MLYDDKKVNHNNKSSLDSRMKKYASEKSVSNENRKWWFDEEKTNENHYSKFLSDKQKISEVIPPDLEKKERAYPDKLADFETSYGVISIGADKDKSDEELVLTILPDAQKDNAYVDERDPFSKNTYLGDVNEDHDDFKLSNLSFRYNFKYDKIDRIDKYEVDGKIDEEDELLYQDDAEEDKIEDLTKKKNDSINENPILEKEIEKTKDIKEKKKKENIDFFEEIKKIISAIGKGKIKKIVESDDAISRRNRIYKMSDNYLLIEQLRLLLKKIKEKELEESFIQKIENSKLKLLTQEQLKEIIIKLQSLENRSEN